MNFLENIGQGKNNWWRYIDFLFVLILANLIGSIPYTYLTIRESLLKNNFDFSKISADLIIELDKNLTLILMLLPFVFTFIVFVLLFKNMFETNSFQIINGTKSLRLNRIFYSALVWMFILGFVTIIDQFIFNTDYQFQFDPINFIILVFISLLLLPIQTTTEELIFRGTITRWIAWVTSSRLASIIIPGILFGLVHISNPEVEKFGTGLAMTQYITMGLFLGLITILDDGMELAIGMHAANNIFASIFITFEGSVLQTYALFRIDTLDPVKDVYALFIGLAVFLFLLHRKYKFDFSVLTKKLEFNTPQIPEPHQDQ